VLLNRRIIMWELNRRRIAKRCIVVVTIGLQSFLYLRYRANNPPLIVFDNTFPSLSYEGLQQSDLIETETDGSILSNSALVVSNETNFFRNDALQQSNMIHTGTKGILSNNSPVLLNETASPLHIEALQQSQLTDKRTNKTASSNGPLAVSNKTSSVNDETLHQFNTSYTTCYIGENAVSLPNVPLFIIAGVQKSGTTAISEIIKTVPGFLRTKKDEGHFLDIELGYEPETSSLDQRCQFLEGYFKRWDFELIQPKTILYEKTPRLIAMDKIPKLIDLFLPRKPKIIVILRDPVERMYSEYKMHWQLQQKRSSSRFPSSFEDNVERSVKYAVKKEALRAPPYSNGTTEWNRTEFAVGKPLEDYSGRAYGGLARGFYVEQMKRYMDVFPMGESLRVVRYESFKKDKIAVMQDLLDFVGGPSSYEFDEKQLDDYLGPFEFVRDRYLPPLTNETMKYLRYLYKPFNDELADLLGESWRGVWDY